MQKDDEKPQLPWRKFASSPLFFVPAALLVYFAAIAFIAAIVSEVFGLWEVNLGGAGFAWLTGVGIGSFAAITGVNVANKMKPPQEENQQQGD